MRSFMVLSVITATANAGGSRALDIEAHRGGRGLYPKNTVPAFANALSMGVDTLELDLGITLDGVIVASHKRGLNSDLARAANETYVAPPGTPFVRLALADIKTCGSRRSA
jgi:glycerophosphoryl diester phosphodiesterase